VWFQIQQIVINIQEEGSHRLLQSQISLNWSLGDLIDVAELKEAFVRALLIITYMVATVTSNRLSSSM